MNAPRLTLDVVKLLNGADVFEKARTHERLEQINAAREHDLLPYFREVDGELEAYGFRRPWRRRDLSDIARSQAAWQFRFYCWRWFVILVPATAQAIEIVAALIAGRSPHVIPLLPR